MVRFEYRSLATLIAVGLSACSGAPIDGADGGVTPIDAHLAHEDGGTHVEIDGGSPATDAGRDAGPSDGGSIETPICVANGARCEGGVCLDGACVPSICGDGVVDSRSEECDDGNDVARDGCEPVTCAVTRCGSDEECGDGEPCNGAEICNLETGQCGAGTALASGAACSTATISGGMCRAAGGEIACAPNACGNGSVDAGEQCDDGNTNANDGCRNDCQFTCTADAQCSDRNTCNGIETCDRATHRCAPGIAMMCNDRNPCTMDSCLPRLDCVHTLIDVDGDGHAPTSLGTCGDDCDDSRLDVNPDQEERCDGLDHDCDGVANSDTPPSWYRDCDEDGYAPLSVLDAADGVRVSCTEPAVSGGCAWTTRRPRVSASASSDCDDTDADIQPRATEIVADEVDQNCDGQELCYVDADNDNHRTSSGSTRVSTDVDCDDAMEAVGSMPADDCCDGDGDVHPGATGWFTSASSCGSWDYDCNSTTTQEFATRMRAGVCSEENRVASCMLVGIGWVGSTEPPACGTSRNWQSGCTFTPGSTAGIGTCASDSTSRLQGCR